MNEINSCLGKVKRPDIKKGMKFIENMVGNFVKNLIDPDFRKANEVIRAY
jgi:hypothetical protein